MCSLFLALCSPIFLLTIQLRTLRKQRKNTTVILPKKNISFTKAKMQFYHLMTLSKNVGLFLREKFFEMIKNVVFDFSKKLVYIFCNTFQWRDLLKKKLSLFFRVVERVSNISSEISFENFWLSKGAKIRTFIPYSVCAMFALKLKKAKFKKGHNKLPLFSWKKISLKKSVAD